MDDKKSQYLTRTTTRTVPQLIVQHFRVEDVRQTTPKYITCDCYSASPRTFVPIIPLVIISLRRKKTC